MIAYIKGELLFKSEERFVVMAGGVGYEVFATSSCLAGLPEKGHQVFVHVYMHVREDAMILYGFADQTEKEMFNLLISVSGIGPRLALTILSGISPTELASAIGNEVIARLVQLAGVGKKTAERLCLELKDKVKVVPELQGLRRSLTANREDELWLDSVSALVNLGYPANNAEDAVRSVMEETDDKSALSLEKIVRQALRMLA